MKRGRKYFGLTASLFILSTLFFQLVGCGYNEEEAHVTAKATQGENKYTYTAEFQQLTIEDYIIEDAIFIKDEIICFSVMNKEAESYLYYK